MPLWVFTHTQNTFSAAEKSELAKLITVLYVKVHIPAFFINVKFLELAPTGIYVGGEERPAALKYAANPQSRSTTLLVRSTTTRVRRSFWIRWIRSSHQGWGKRASIGSILFKRRPGICGGSTGWFLRRRARSSRRGG
jgi:hypothetical protein